jgi:hypothetical protein
MIQAQPAGDPSAADRSAPLPPRPGPTGHAVPAPPAPTPRPHPADSVAPSQPGTGPRTTPAGTPHPGTGPKANTCSRAPDAPPAPPRPVTACPPPLWIRRSSCARRTPGQQHARVIQQFPRAGRPGRSSTGLIRPARMAAAPAQATPGQPGAPASTQAPAPVRRRRWPWCGRRARARRGPIPQVRPRAASSSALVSDPRTHEPTAAHAARSAAALLAPGGAGCNCEPRCSSGSRRPNIVLTSGDSWRQLLRP